MIKHYFKIALRNLGRQKILSFINISGLSIGLACFTLFLLYAMNEFNFDRFHKNADNIYRVYRWSELKEGPEATKGDIYMPMPLGPAMKQDLPDVLDYVRVREPWGQSNVRVGKNISSIGVSFADPRFFSVFSFPLKKGSVSSVLHDMHNIVLSEKTAKQLFGNDDPVGKTVEIKLENEFEPFVVTGIAENIPSNSTIHFEILGNYEFLATGKRGESSINNWHRAAFMTYVQLRNGSTLHNDPLPLQLFRKKYYPGEEGEFKGMGIWKGNGSPIHFGLQPLRSMHTDTYIDGGDIPPVNPKTVWILLSIAGGLLLIACINFTTLSIGRSANRAREIGVRKIIGSNSRQLVFQFLAEALLLTIFSVLLGLMMGKLLLPWFNQLSGRELTFSFVQFPEMTWLIACLTIIVSLLAGSYPAMILSRFRPLEVLRQKIRIGGANFFTKALVTLQFVISIGLMVSTLVILRQIKFMTGKYPGFSKENVVVVDASDTKTREIYPLFKQALASRNDITGIASAELSLGEGTGWSRSGFEYNGKHKDVFEYFIDPDYIPVMGMQLIAGRNFDSHIADDTSTSIIVNEAMVRDFGWTVGSAVGQQIKGYTETKIPVVIGVVKDFHYRPFKEKVEPQLFQQFADYTPYKFFVRIKPGNPAPALAAMQKTWSTVVADLPFKYSFLDESIDNFYKAERRWSGIIGWAGGISVFLACLGLFGLAALSAVNRTKEIGIRKVLGASLPVIVKLLSKDFLKLVIIALIIAAPVAWYFMNKWLQDFAYRISIGWGVFIIAGALAVMIAFITICFQAVRAGIANPVKSLRTE
jgi:putative ABC transport system permease protein